MKIRNVKVLLTALLTVTSLTAMASADHMKGMKMSGKHSMTAAGMKSCCAKAGMKQDMKMSGNHMTAMKSCCKMPGMSMSEMHKCCMPSGMKGMSKTHKKPMAGMKKM